MALRKNPAHPAARAAEEHNTAAPAPAAAPAAVDPPATPVDAPAPPAAPVLTAEEILRLQQRLAVSEREAAEFKRRIPEVEAEAAQAASRARAELDPELERLRADLAARDEQMSKLLAEQNQRELDDLLKFDSTTLSNVDPEVARELADKVLKPFMSKVRGAYDTRLQDINQSIERYRSDNDKRFEDMTKAEQARARRDINAALLAKVPDFVELNQSEAFEIYKAQRPDGGRRTIGDELIDAYKEGDVDFIASHVARFQNSKPSIRDVADVDMTNVQASATTAATTDQTKYTYKQLADKKFEFQRGRITRQQFAAWRADFEKAEAEGRVS